MVAPAFSWDQFQKNEPEKPSQVMARQEPEQTKKPENNTQNMSWGNFQNTSTYQGKPDPTADESTFGVLVRNASANATRYVEGFLGRYGDVKQFVGNFLADHPESLGLLGTSLQELMGKDAWDKMMRGQTPAQEGTVGEIAQNLTGGIANKIPTSREIRTATEGITGEYLKPKTKNEKRIQEYSSDLGSMGAQLLHRMGASRLGLIANFGIPAAANAAKASVEELGFGEDAGTWTKLAAWTALSLLNSVNAPAYAATLMNEGRNGFGPNNVANIPRYTHALDAVDRNMLRGDPRSALAQQQIAGIRQDIQNGQTTQRDLMNRYDAINATKRDRGLFELGRTDRRAAIRNINEVRDAVRAEIETVGAANPQALESWRNGIQAFAVIHQSNAITNWASRQLSGPYAKTAAATLFGGAAKTSPLLTGTVSAGLPAAYKIGQVGYRVLNDPNLAHYYWEAINAARRQDQVVFMKNINKLNKDYEKKFGSSSVEDNRK